MTVTCVVDFGDDQTDLTALRWATRRAATGDDRVTTVRAADVGDADFGRDVGVYVAGSPEDPDDHDLRDRIVEFAGRATHPVIVVRRALADRAPDRPTLPVTAGVPRSASAWSLLDFAADEAEAGGSPLVLVRVWRDSGWAPSATRDEVAQLVQWRTTDRDRLDTAAEYVRATHPRLSVRADLLDGDVWDFMTDAAAASRMLVLGTTPQHREGLGAWALAHLAVPVALVPATADIRSGSGAATALVRS